MVAQINMTVYEQMLNAQKSKAEQTNIREILDVTEITNRKLDQLYSEMSQLTKKPVYEDFSYKAGKLIGVLRHIQQNPKQRKELLKLTNLTGGILDLYNQSCGQLPYCSKDSNTIVTGRAQDCSTLREVLLVAATRMRVLLADYQLEDITEEHWDNLYKKAQETAEANADLNQKTGQAVNYNE